MEEQRTSLIRNFENILVDIEQKSQSEVKLHEVESDLFRSVLELGYQLLLYFLSLVNQKWSHNSFFHVSKDLNWTGKYYSKGYYTRHYQSVFGRVPIRRQRYYNILRKRSIFFMDQQLGLPENGQSYLLQDWLGQSSSELVYEQSVKLINNMLGLKLKGMQVKRLNGSIHKSASDFYSELPKEESVLQTDAFAVASFDGKGIPIRADERGEKAESSAVRLGKGQKRGTKKEVTVSVNYVCDQRIRSADQVLDSFFSAQKMSAEDQQQETTQQKKEKHLKGFLCGQKKGVRYGLERMRDTAHPEQPLVVLIDGNRGLEKAVDSISEELGITHRIEAKVLDFVHVTEYVWKVANALLGENNEDRLSWVKNACRMLLEGQAAALVEQWKKHLNKPGKGQQSIKAAVTYFENHLSMMHYDEYLQKGMPISTGVVESACGYFIQQRFDTNGMHWSMEGAQQLIDLRAIHLNGDWKTMMQKHIEREQQQLYGFYPKVA